MVFEFESDVVNVVICLFLEAPTEKKEETKKEEQVQSEDDLVFVAFARVFSGTVKKGQSLYVLAPKHDPKDAIAKVKSPIFIFSKVTNPISIFEASQN